MSLKVRGVEKLNYPFAEMGKMKEECTSSGKVKMFQCNECKKKFNYKKCLLTHLERQHLSKKSSEKCEQNKSITKLVQNNGKNICNVCGRTFGRRSKLIIHVKSVHQKIKEFSCNVCGKQFSSRYKVNRHLVNVHKTDPLPKNFSCDSCDEQFYDESQLKIHIGSVHKNFTCAMCCKKFSHQEKLNAHVKISHLDDHADFTDYPLFPLFPLLLENLFSSF